MSSVATGLAIVAIGTAGVVGMYVAAVKIEEFDKSRTMVPASAAALILKIGSVPGIVPVTLVTKASKSPDKINRLEFEEALNGAASHCRGLKEVESADYTAQVEKACKSVGNALALAQKRYIG